MCERASAVPCARRMRWDAGCEAMGELRRLARRGAAGRALGRRAGGSVGSPYAASPTVVSAAPRRLCPLLARRCTEGMYWGGPDAAVLTALRAAAVYKAHCLCPHGRLRRSPAAAEAMKQALREAVRGHRRAARVYDAAQNWT